MKPIPKKYLTIFINRVIPDYWKEQYPKLELFIKYFFQFLEEENRAFSMTENYTNIIDIDYINSITDETLRSSLIESLYSQYLGSENARYISTLLDDILYLKHQKSINNKKGLKSNFMFFLLIILNGYFSVENIGAADNKQHNSIFRYDGTLTYSNLVGYIEPYKYLLVSEFTYDQYNSAIDLLNPAGILPIPVFQRQVGVYYDDNYYVTSDEYAEDLYDISNNTYFIAVYNTYITTKDEADTQTGKDWFYDDLQYISKITTSQYLQLKSDSEDLYLQNGKTYTTYDYADLDVGEFFVKLDTSFSSENFLIDVDNNVAQNIQYVRLLKYTNATIDLTQIGYKKADLIATGVASTDFDFIGYDTSDYSVADESTNADKKTIMNLNYNNKTDINGIPYQYYIKKNTQRVLIEMIIKKVKS